MAVSYLKRLDVGYPPFPDIREFYAVKYFEHANAATLQTNVNAFLLALPVTLSPDWMPHIPRTFFGTFGTGGGFRHFCWLTIYAAGRAGAPPLVV